MNMPTTIASTDHQLARAPDRVPGAAFAEATAAFAEEPGKKLGRLVAPDILFFAVRN